MQYMIIYNKTTNRYEPHQRRKEGDTWEQCTTYAFAPNLPLSFEKREHALSWVRRQESYEKSGF